MVLADIRIVQILLLLSVYRPLNLLIREWRRRKPTYVTAEANMTSGMTSGLLTSTSAARCFQNTKINDHTTPPIIYVNHEDEDLNCIRRSPFRRCRCLSGWSDWSSIDQSQYYRLACGEVRRSCCCCIAYVQRLGFLERRAPADCHSSPSLSL